MRRILPLVALLTLPLTACGGGDTTGSGAGAPGGDVDGDWVLVEGVDVPAGSRVTLSVDGDEVGGTAACNGYGGTVDRDGDAFVVGGLSMTEMGCDGPVQQAESAFVEAFTQVRRAVVEDGRLVLTGTAEPLVFAKVEPVDASALVGTTWTLEGVVTGTGDEGAVASPVGDPATFRLDDDGTMTASTGCRGLSGEWTTSGDEVLLPTFGVADGEPVTCPGDLGDQDDHVVTVLGDGFRAAVDGDRLTLTDGELGLVYRSGAAAEAITPEASAVDVREVVRDTTWRVVEGSLRADPVDDGSPRPTLTFSDGSLGGDDTCNTFGASLELDARGRATVGEVQMTRRACEDNPWDGLAAALPAVTTIAPVDDGLLHVAGRGIELLLEPVS